MYNQRGRREPRQSVWSPNKVETYRGQNGDVHFHPVDEATMAAFFQNIRKLDEGNLRAAAAQAPLGSFNGGSPVAIFSIESLRSALKPGETLFTGLETDGPERQCALCGEQFQPHKRSAFQRDEGAVTFVGGDVAILKKDVLLNFVASLQNDYATKKATFDAAMTEWQAKQPAGSLPAGKFLDLSAASRPTAPVDPTPMIQRIVASVEATMAEVIGDGKPPELTVAAPVGFKCGCQDGLKDRIRVTFVALESVPAALDYVDKVIGTNADRYVTVQLLDGIGGGRRPQRHAVGSGPGPSDGRRRDQRPEKPHRDWHGADLEVATADALDVAGYTGIAAALAGAENGELLAKGIVHAGSIGPVTFALRRASEGRQVMGEARSSARRQQLEAGAGRPGGDKKPRGRRREITAPDAPPRRSVGKVGLADLGS